MRVTILRSRYISFIGIDPGVSGGLVILEYGKDKDTDFAHVCSILPMPTTERDIYDALNIYEDFDPERVVVYIEKVHSFPSDSAKAAFKFGTSYGFLKGVVTSIGYVLKEVSPQVWQKKYVSGTFSSKNERKNKLKQAAQRLYPTAKVTLKTADALLIADYAYSQEKG